MVSGLGPAVGAGAPVDDLGLIDPEARVVAGVEAGGFADGAVDIDCFAAGATDEVMVVVADAVFIEGGGAGGLNAADEAGLGEGAEGVVDGLAGDCADGTTDILGDGVGGGVGVGGDGPQHGQALGGHGEAVFPEKLCGAVHEGRYQRKMDFVKK